MATPLSWSSDVRVSMPLPPKHERRVSMYGFSFTDGGLAHDISPADYARLSIPTFAPDDLGQDTVYHDTALDHDTPPIDLMRF